MRTTKRFDAFRTDKKKNAADKPEKHQQIAIVDTSVDLDVSKTRGTLVKKRIAPITRQATPDRHNFTANLCLEAKIIYCVAVTTHTA